MFLPYQKVLYDDKSRFIIVLKSRQIGLTTIFAFKAVMDCIFNDRNQIIVSASQRQSNIVGNMMAPYIEKYAEVAGLKLVNDMRTEKTFNNGRYIVLLPCSPNTVRGYSGDIWLDEFAIYSDDKAMYEALMPIITRGFNLKITSTAFGQNNLFYEIYNDILKYPDYKRYKIDIYDAIKDGMPVDIDIIKNNIDEDSFAQEYECKWIDESTAYYPYELIKKCISEYIVADIDGTETYMGIDIGRKKDRTEIVVIRKKNGIFYLIDNVTLYNTDFAAQFSTIIELMNKHRVTGCSLDGTSIGMALGEELHKRDNRITSLWFTNKLKVELATTLKAYMEKGEIRFNKDDILIRQLHSIRKHITNANNITFDEIRDDTGHCDKAIALQLAVNAIKKVSSPKLFIL